MADMHFSDMGTGDDGFRAGFDTGSIGKLFNYLGALSAVVLIAGLVWWGYDLLMRDVTGVPVVRALEGPARVQPDDPGGRIGGHQGLAVNSVQADAVLSGQTAEVQLAPAPITLAAEDAILPNLDEAEIAPAVADDAQDTQATPRETNTIDAVDAAIAMALSGDAAPAAVNPITGQKLVPTTVSGVKFSPRPDLRPRVTPAAFRAPAVATPSGQLDLDPAAIATGTRLVQLGAFDDREKAIEAWDQTAAQFVEYMDGKQRIIQEAQSGGRKFFRLRVAGFSEDISASRRFCAVLMAQNASCIPVAAR